MLRLLLDEHLSPVIATQVRAHNPAIIIFSLQEWKQGAYMRAPDEEILRAAHGQDLTLVTYDQRTIWPLLKGWGEQGIAHGGVIFVNRFTLAQEDIGGIVRALLRLWELWGWQEWANQVIYLAP